MEFSLLYYYSKLDKVYCRRHLITKLAVLKKKPSHVPLTLLSQFRAVSHHQLPPAFAGPAPERTVAAGAALSRAETGQTPGMASFASYGWARPYYVGVRVCDTLTPGFFCC